MKAEEIIKKLDKKRALLVSLKGDIKQLERLYLEAITGFKEGDLVVNEKGEKGVLVHGDSYNVWWSMRKFKKDGTPSNIIVNTYNNIERVEQ